MIRDIAEADDLLRLEEIFSGGLLRSEFRFERDLSSKTHKFNV